MMEMTPVKCYITGSISFNLIFGCIFLSYLSFLGSFSSVFGEDSAVDRVWGSDMY